MDQSQKSLRLYKIKISLQPNDLKYELNLRLFIIAWI